MALLSGMRCKLVIFDCDGVLVDTEDVANRHLAQVLVEAGYPVTYEECRRRFVGRTIESIQHEVEAASGVVLGVTWPDTLRQGTERAFEAGIEAIPGVAAAIESVRQAGLSYCVASSGRFSKMRLSLGKAGLLPLVEDVLFSAEQVARGKPAPDLFLHAASAMNATPAESVVVEDTVAGVTAAVAAGMRVLAYTGDPFTDADALKCLGAEPFDDMAALPDLVLGRPPA